MRQLLFVSLAFGVVMAAATFVLVHDVPETAQANHSTPGGVDTHIVHVHDLYYHPEPLTGPWANHGAAQADCEAASPAPQCNMTIDVGDSVEWWTKPPFHSAPHTVTECTDGSFTNCGAAVDPNNPIGDSGVFPGGAAVNTLRYGPITFTAPGAYFYRCDLHPGVMVGRIVVQALTTPPAGDPVVGGRAGLVAEGADPAPGASESQSSGSAALLAIVAGALVVGGIAGAGVWRRLAVREAPVDDADRRDGQS